MSAPISKRVLRIAPGAEKERVSRRQQRDMRRKGARVLQLFLRRQQERGLCGDLQVHCQQQTLEFWPASTLLKMVETGAAHTPTWAEYRALAQRVSAVAKCREAAGEEPSVL